jgi:3,4-dihydroxy 2-butanone 4-phosphate synthase / GTP cyclohydrolase II
VWICPPFYGDFKLHVFEEKLTGEHHLAFAKGKWAKDDPVLVRVHSSNPLADIFGSKRSDKTGILHQCLKWLKNQLRSGSLYGSDEP